MSEPRPWPFGGEHVASLVQWSGLIEAAQGHAKAPEANPAVLAPLADACWDLPPPRPDDFHLFRSFLAEARSFAGATLPSRRDRAHRLADLADRAGRRLLQASDPLGELVSREPVLEAHYTRPKPQPRLDIFG